MSICRLLVGFAMIVATANPFLAAHCQAMGPDSEVGNVQANWRGLYPGLIKGQDSARRDWAKSSERAVALKSLQKSTRDLNHSFSRFGKQPSPRSAQSVIEGVASFCQSLGQVMKLRGAFSEVSYVMSLSESESMGRLFYAKLSDPLVQSSCAQS